VRSLADEVPFDIPDSWEWVRLGSAFAIEMGQSPAGNTVSGNCSGTEFHQGKVFFGEKYIKASDQYTSSPTKFAPKNSVLLCVRAPVGKVNITDRGLCIGRGLCAIIPLAGMPLLFAYYLLAAYENIFVKQATGTTFVAITAETVKNQLIPMPPLAEQQRIADLIERLIPYVDEYGKAESAVDQLNCHFPEALKKSILQEAVQGKLVPQDPSDEPAEALLDRIRAEKQRLIKEGKIKKDKHESVIFRRDNSHYEKRGSEEVCIDDEIPFEIPENWAWCRFETATLYVTDYVANGSFASLRENVKTYKEENYALMVKTQDFSNDFTRGLTYTDQKGFDYLQKSRLYGGELMLSNIGASIGKAFIVPTMNIRMTLAPNAIVVKCLDAIMTEYLRYFILSYYGQKMLSDFTAGTAMPKFSKTQLRSALIPVPPCSEQRRIIEKIKQLDVLVCTL